MKRTCMGNFYIFVVLLYFFSIFHHDYAIAYNLNFVKGFHCYIEDDIRYITIFKTLTVFSLKERKKRGYPRPGQDIPTEIMIEKVLDEVGLSQECKAAPAACCYSQVRVVTWRPWENGDDQKLFLSCPGTLPDGAVAASPYPLSLYQSRKFSCSWRSQKWAST